MTRSRLERTPASAWTAAALAVLSIACGGAPPASAPSPAPSPARPALRAEPSPPDDACTTFEAQAAAVLRESDAEIDSLPREPFRNTQDAWHEMTDGLRRCARAGSTTWMFLPEAPDVEDLPPGSEAWPPGREPSLQVGYRLVAARARGSIIEGTRSSMGGDANGWEKLAILGTADLDGDGSGELAVATHQHDDVDYEILTLAGDRIVDFVPASIIGFGRVVDHDRDGRIDLVNHERWWPCQVCNASDGECGTTGCPEVLYHAVPGGWSHTDAVAVAFLEAQCRPSPARWLELDEVCGDYAWPNARNHAACARLRSATAAEVEVRIRADYARVRPECQDESELEGLLSHARVDPPLTLPPVPRPP